MIRKVIVIFVNLDVFLHNIIETKKWYTYNLLKYKLRKTYNFFKNFKKIEYSLDKNYFYMKQKFSIY